MKTLKASERLIVAADNENPTDLARTLMGTGIVFKENVSLRNAGYRNRIDEIHALGFVYFADLKLNDIEATMRRDGKALRPLRPDIDILTVMCNAPLKALRGIREELPDTEILGVTVLTDFTEDECQELYGHGIEDQVKYFTHRALSAGLNGIVCAPKEIPFVRSVSGDSLTINTPNIRPASLPVPGDDQNTARALDIKGAFDLGVTRIVVGRPILKAADPREAVAQIIREIVLADP